MAEKQVNKTSPWLFPATVLGGVLLLIGGASSGNISLVLLAVAATAVLLWTIKSRNDAE